jgi:hypothetical protein
VTQGSVLTQLDRDRSLAKKATKWSLSPNGVYCRLRQYIGQILDTISRDAAKPLI